MIVAIAAIVSFVGAWTKAKRQHTLAGAILTMTTWLGSEIVRYLIAYFVAIDGMQWSLS